MYLVSNIYVVNIVYQLTLNYYIMLTIKKNLLNVQISFIFHLFIYLPRDT